MVQPQTALALINALMVLDAQLLALETAVNAALADLPPSAEYHTLTSMDAALQVVRALDKDWLDRCRVLWP